jgi:hypothetical protein
MQRIRRKLTYSNIVSTFCLVLLLGGGSLTPPRSSGKKRSGRGR